MTAHRDTINRHNAAAERMSKVTATATRYTDAQAEAAKLDSVYSWYDVRVSSGEGSSKFEADYIVGINAHGLPFCCDWDGGDYFGEDGDNAASLAAIASFNRGE